MTKVTAQISISLDGFAAGPNQTEADPLGAGGERLHHWMFTDDKTAVDEEAVAEILEGTGAYVMGRNMFGPIRGAWTGDWRGWWGDDPPYHAPVFVLTHHPRDPVVMEGGTTFFFVTDGIESAVAQARAAAGAQDVGIAGGAQTLRQAFAAGLVDEIDIHITPVMLGAGERLFGDGLGDVRFEQVAVRPSDNVIHARYRVVR